MQIDICTLSQHYDRNLVYTENIVHHTILFRLWFPPDISSDIRQNLVPAALQKMESSVTSISLKMHG